MSKASALAGAVCRYNPTRTNRGLARRENGSDKMLSFFFYLGCFPLFSSQKFQMSLSTIHMYGRWMFESIGKTDCFYLVFQSKRSNDTTTPSHLCIYGRWMSEHVQKSLISNLFSRQIFQMSLPPPHLWPLDTWKSRKVRKTLWFYFISQSNSQMSLPPPPIYRHWMFEKVKKSLWFYFIFQSNVITASHL